MSQSTEALPPGRLRRHRRRTRERFRRRGDGATTPPPASAPPRSTFKENLSFFVSFLRRPSVIGSLVPSSETLARALLEGCDLRRARAVVELGPGTGPVTRPILSGIGSQTLFFALELDREHVRGLRESLPKLRVYHDSAAELARYLARFRLRYANVIVSCLPWASMPPKVQHDVFGAVANCLAPDGVFVAFGYVHAWWMPGAVRFRKLLRERFQTVEVSPVIWRNVPPALVLRCRGGVGGPLDGAARP